MSLQYEKRGTNVFECVVDKRLKVFSLQVHFQSTGEVPVSKVPIFQILK